MAKKLLLTTAAVTLIAVIAMPVFALPATATRILPASVASGAEFGVAIEASGCGAFGQVVETLPDGFTYLGCTPSDIGVEQIGNIVKFTFLGDSASFTYRIKSPNITATTTYTLRGVVKDVDKNEYPIEDSDITVTASAPPSETYTLTIVVIGNGSTTPSSQNSHTHDAGTVVDIDATPASGWQFDDWSGDVANPISSFTTVTMDEDKTIVANFSEILLPVYTLTVTCKPSNGGDVVPAPTAWANQYEANASVTLTAIPIEGYIFSGWGGDLSENSNPATIIMNANKSVIANFALLEKVTSFVVSPLSISPEKVKPEETVHIFVNVANSGGKTGNYEAFLYINGSLEAARKVEVPQNSSQNVVFDITKQIPDTYIVSIGGQQGKFIVEGKESFFSRLGITDTIAIIVIVALVAALIFVFRRIKRRA